MRVSMRGCYTRDYSTRGHSARENRGIDTRGTTRDVYDVYVPRHEETWSMQTRNGIHYDFVIVPRVSTRVKMKL